MAKSFWEYLTTPRKHACDIADCEPHKYFIERFNEYINKVDKIDIHSCEGMRKACESLAERFNYQEQWISKLHERIDTLENNKRKK
jgi:hypothetical protein